jgi:hypothetical protein
MSDEERKALMALVLFRAENYARILKQAVRGLGSQLTDKPELFQEAYALELFAEEIREWLSNQNAAMNKLQTDEEKEVAKPQAADNAVLLH